LAADTARRRVIGSPSKLSARSVCDCRSIASGDEHIDHAVLERLKFPNRLPKLMSGLRVSNRRCQERID